jgi:1,4-dihydroxy-6-naphthoate synthase
MNLTLGFSTCPNDTFIFDAMIHGKVDTEGLRFQTTLADVEALNRNAFETSVDITKLSYHAYIYVAHNYKLLTSGSALGRKNGPLLISKHKIYPDEVYDLKVAVPGKYTTANLLFSIEFPVVKEKIEYLFSEIEEAILGKEADAGVIIHENRFTYRQRGLTKIMDLGENWEEKTGHAIPLGGIAIRRGLNQEIQQKVNRVLRRSTEFALKNPDSSSPFVKKHAREMDNLVMKKHIELYVNAFTRDLGSEGKDAIKKMYEEAHRVRFISSIPKDIFVI